MSVIKPLINQSLSKYKGQQANNINTAAKRSTCSSLQSIKAVPYHAINEKVIATQKKKQKTHTKKDCSERNQGAAHLETQILLYFILKH